MRSMNSKTSTANALVVLTGQDQRFSAGLDLGEHFPLFASAPEQVAEWFREYRATNMRLFTYPRPTDAAVNGHAFAGGLITAAVCDYRVAVDTGARFSLNEVAIGIPMPAVYVRMLSYAWGERAAARTSLFSEAFEPDQAHQLGLVDELSPPDKLLPRAIAVAGSIPEDCVEQYGRSDPPPAAAHRHARRQACQWVGGSNPREKLQTREPS
jgi:enoyl-CoA hydratase